MWFWTGLRFQENNHPLLNIGTLYLSSPDCTLSILISEKEQKLGWKPQRFVYHGKWYLKSGILLEGPLFLDSSNKPHDLICLYFHLFWGRVSLCSPGWPWTHDSLASASRVLGLQSRTNLPDFGNLLLLAADRREAGFPGGREKMCGYANFLQLALILIGRDCVLPAICLQCQYLPLRSFQMKVGKGKHVIHSLLAN
jgi:hypothetical protein